MKKTAVLAMCFILIFGVLSACSKASTTTETTVKATSAPTSTETPAKKNVTIRWSQFQIEVAEQVKALAKQYETEHPNVKIEIDVMGDGYFDKLKANAAGSEMPDIFMTKGYNYLDTYGRFMADLSDQKFASQIVDASKPAITKDGKVLGLPVRMDGFGIVYNKTIFKDNGLEIPKTFDELKATAEKLKAKGITPFINQFKDNWVLGLTLGAEIGAQKDAITYIQSLNANKTTFKNTPEILNSVKLIDLATQYGQTKPLDADWNAAAALMGQGKGAMMIEGAWVYDTIAGIDPKIDLGMFAIPFTNNASDSKLNVDVNGVWHISKDSKNIDTAKDILNWIASSEAGKKFVKDTKAISAYKGVDSITNSVGKDIVSNISTNKTSVWGWLSYPDGYEAESGNIFQEYIASKKDQTWLLDNLDEKWKQMNKK